MRESRAEAIINCKSTRTDKEAVCYCSSGHPHQQCAPYEKICRIYGKANELKVVCMSNKVIRDAVYKIEQE